MTRLKLHIVKADQTGAIIKCRPASAERLIKLLGGSYKIAKITGKDLSDSIKQVPLPYSSKFEWTVSSYKATEDLIQAAKEEMRDNLKMNDLGKSKYLSPTFDEDLKSGENEDEVERGIHELKAADVSRRIFSPDNEGLDLVVHGGIEDSGAFFGYTVGLSDIEGFERRDFERPYQDPRITIGTRLARILCNFAAPAEGILLCDPFCGMGTVLQEAMMTGHSIIGVDKKSDNVFKAKSNLEWLANEYSIERSKIIRMMRYDSQRISELPFPKLDCIASEPILLPTYRSNPSGAEARISMRDARDVYEKSMESMERVLASSQSRIALVTPTLVDSKGSFSTLSLNDFAVRIGLKQYWPKAARQRPPYPLRIDTSKKKIVQRNISLFAPS
ncbi:MAG: TRM11 family SAM-dependent methyltransferase [Nitrososphaerales archaeon]